MSQPQLPLQLSMPPADQYASWVRHTGVEDACNRVALWSVHGSRIWLTSSQAAGKSHLLRSLASDHAGTALLSIDNQSAHTPSWRLTQQWLDSLEGNPRWLIDLPAGVISQSLAYALFHLLERARDLQRPLIISWRGESESLPPELSSRLHAMEKVTMSPPDTDEELLEVLEKSAGKLQWEIRAQVLQAMLTYLPRDLGTLVSTLRKLERLSFEQGHRPGPAWVKKQLMLITADL